MNEQFGIAVIVDGVRSRSHADRTDLQRALEESATAVNDQVPTQRPLAPTVGDEMQGAYADLTTALHAVLLIRLALREPFDCRVGLGAGTWSAASDDAAIVDGPAWWAARDAINEAKKRESTRQPGLRSWFVMGEGTSTADVGIPSAHINAYLSCRDEIVSMMNARQRRLTWGTVIGHSQAQLAGREGISVSAVSQNLRRSGASGLLAAVSLVRPT